ncbi:MAG: hypothetical protein H0V18_04805 [Pyrinomonadaceae bacterium]|nr:hypothetical protein [Pyrinomonadaceae bacterium]
MQKLAWALVMVLLTVSFAAADTIYLRDGRTVQGTLIGFINGRFAIRVGLPRSTTTGVSTSAGAGEIQYFRPNEVDRVEIEGRSLDDLRFDLRTVEVTLGPNWIDTGVDVRRDERLQVRASGTILAGRTRITPDGLRQTDPTAPLPRASEGLLIGVIGNDFNTPIIEIGSSREFVADRDGRLYLTANRGSYTDARGSFTVEIRRERDLTTDDDNISDRRRDRIGTVRPRRPRVGTGVPRELEVEVPGTSRGVDSGIDVRVGDQLTFTASGRVIAGRRIGEVGPEGGRASGFGSIIGTRPVPTVGPGALISFIRMADGQISQPFPIGSQLTFTANADGRLFLAINDDDYSDNGGAFQVRIRYANTSDRQP